MHMPYGKMILYADDAQFLDTEPPSNSHVLKARVEANFSTAFKWFTQNRLKINPSKTEMVVIKSKRMKFDEKFSVQFGAELVTPSSNVKVLGVIIDQHLSWERHVSIVVQRCYAVLIGLARMRHRVPEATKRMLVESLVLPHVRYCVSVWGSCTIEQKKRVQRAINFGARIVTGLGRREHVTPVLEQLGWQKIDEMIRAHDVSIVSRLLTASDAAEILCAKLVPRSEISSQRTRASTSGQLQLPRVKTELARRSFMCRAIRAWNSALE